MNLPDIDNYRVFIREFLRRKAPKTRGEIAKLAAHIGVHPTFVSQVLTGVKDFSLEQSYGVTSYLDLSETETKYFLLLVQKERAGSKELRIFFEKELQSIRSELLSVTKRLAKHRALGEQQKAIFYSSWIYSAVRLYCSVGNGKTCEEVAAEFQITRVRALSILNFLTEAALCDIEGEHYRLGTQHTHLDANSPFIQRHHMNWRTKALQRHENISPHELAMTAPLSISVKDFQVIREKLLACLKESFEVAKNSPAEDVAFLNIDFLWLKKKD